MTTTSPLLGPIVGSYDQTRGVVADVEWAVTLRRLARWSIWALPPAAVCLALAGVWDLPTATGPAPGRWLVTTIVGLALALLGLVGLAALLAPTQGRRWAVTAIAGTLLGTVLVAPVLGVIGLARPPSDPDSGLDPWLDGPVGRWLGVGGLALLAVGWLAMGLAILASGVLNRHDGFFVLAAVALSVGAAYLGWQFLLAVAAMMLLGAGLGLCWTAARLTPDGSLRP